MSYGNGRLRDDGGNQLLTTTALTKQVPCAVRSGISSTAKCTDLIIGSAGKTLT